MKLFITGVNHLKVNDRWMVERAIGKLFPQKKISKVLITDSSNPVNVFASFYALKNSIYYRVFHRRYDKINEMSVIKTIENGKKINASAAFDRDKIAIRQADAVLFIWDGKTRREKNLISLCQNIGKGYKIFWCKNIDGDVISVKEREIYEPNKYTFRKGY